jgi:hypothetical protein
VKGVEYCTKSQVTSNATSETHWRLQNTTDDTITAKIVVEGFSMRMITLKPHQVQTSDEDRLGGQVVGLKAINRVTGAIITRVVSTERNPPGPPYQGGDSATEQSASQKADKATTAATPSVALPSKNLCKAGSTVLTGKCTCPKGSFPVTVDARLTKCERITFSNASKATTSSGRQPANEVSTPGSTTKNSCDMTDAPPTSTPTKPSPSIRAPAQGDHRTDNADLQKQPQPSAHRRPHVSAARYIALALRGKL